MPYIVTIQEVTIDGPKYADRRDIYTQEFDTLAVRALVAHMNEEPAPEECEFDRSIRRAKEALASMPISTADLPQSTIDTAVVAATPPARPKRIRITESTSIYYGMPFTVLAEKDDRYMIIDAGGYSVWVLKQECTEVLP